MPVARVLSSDALSSVLRASQRGLDGTPRYDALLFAASLLIFPDNVASIPPSVRNVMADTTATRQRPEAAPSSEAVDSFFSLFGKGTSASSQGRFLRAAVYYERAAADARVLWEDKGELCVVHAKLKQRDVLVTHAMGTNAVDEAMPLWLQAHRLVVECRRILNARLSANTCLVGRCFAVEEDFYVQS